MNQWNFMKSRWSRDESHDAPEPDAPEHGGATLHRSNTKKVFGGVAGGLAERFDVDANIVRVVFVVLALVYGLGIAIYLAMWALIPRSSAPVENAVVVTEDAPRVRWLRYAIPLGVLVLAVIFISTLRHLPVFGASFAILWVIFLMAVAVLALFSPARRLTFRRARGAGVSRLREFSHCGVGRIPHHHSRTWRASPGR